MLKEDNKVSECRQSMRLNISTAGTFSLLSMINPSTSTPTGQQPQLLPLNSIPVQVTNPPT